MWHFLDIKEVFKRLHTNIYGLTDKEAERRLLIYGKNEIKIKKPNIIIETLKEQLTSPLILLLVFASLLSFYIGENLEGKLILVIILIYIAFDLMQRYKSDKVLDLLEKESITDTVVIRDGKKKKIKSIYLVPGDIVVLKQGDKVPADIRIINSRKLYVDESIITGESKPVKKENTIVPENSPIYERKNILYSGSYIVKGYVEGVVVATGNNTFIGKLAKKLESVNKKETPLEKAIKEFTKLITIFTVVIIIFVLILSYYMNLFDLFDSILFSIALGVAVIPEGLPTILVVLYSISLKRIYSKGAILKKLDSVETLGSVDTIFTDKTGTLTYNQLTARLLWYSNKEYEITGKGYEPSGEIMINKKSANKKDLELVGKVCINCSDTDLIYENGEWKVVGDPLEGALISLAYKIGIKKRDNIVYVEEFDRVRKMMSVVVKEGDNYIVYSKGAPERILEKSKYILIDNKIQSIENYRNTIIKKINEYTSKGYRTIALAYKKINNFDEKNIENDLIFLSIVALEDPIREDVKEAIEFAKKSGIDVIIISGDHPKTVRTIAKKIGIDTDVLTSQEIKNLSLKEIYEILKNDIKIVARADPEDKYRVLKAFKEMGEVVAMTGDGVNDAPALKLADIGISLENASDIAKEASDMILLNNSFSSIIEAIKEGRRIFYDIKAIVNMVLSVNMGLVTSILLFFFTLKKVIFNAIHILFINVAIETINSITSGTHPINEKMIYKKPGKDIIDKSFVLSILLLGVSLGFLVYIVYFLTDSNYAAILFLVTAQYPLLVFNQLKYNIEALKNKYTYIAGLISTIITILLYHPAIKNKIGIDNIEVRDLLVILSASLIYTIIVLIIDKYTKVKFTNH